MRDDPSGDSVESYLEAAVGTASDHYRTIVPLLYRRLEEADPESPVTASYRLWQDSLDVNVSTVESAVTDTISELGLGAEGEDAAERFLYCLQSYYALVLQVDRIASLDGLSEEPLLDDVDYEVLCAEFDSVLDQPEDRLFAGWLRTVDFGSEPFRGLVATVVDAPRRRAGEDAFKALYQDVVGSPYRKALGEFYTRQWVTDHVLDEIDYDGGRVLDPACGSGAFLVSAANRVLRDGDGPAAIERIYGFDLNPVAVMAAKSNLLGVYAAHADGRNGERPDLPEPSLNVYWTNSIVWSEPDLSGNNITQLGPFGELSYPTDATAAASKVRQDLADRVADAPYAALVDDDWIDDLARSFVAPIACDPFEYVVGNPPWVSPDRMPKGYRDRVTDLLEESGYLEPFQPDYLSNRFPNRQFVAALPFYEVTMNRYLQPDGTCAFLVTSSLLKSMNGGGFREQLQNWTVTDVLDFTPYTDIHRNANSWAVVPVVTKSTAFDGSTRYRYYSPTDGDVPAHPGSCRTVETPDGDLHVCSWDVPLADLPFIPSDPRSPWFTAPPDVVASYRTLIDDHAFAGERHRFTRGLVTGRNAVYLLSDVERTDGVVDVRSGAADGRIELEPDLVYPFVEGKHLAAWHFDHTHLLLPYELPEWDPLPEETLQREYPAVASYLDANRDDLENRRTQTIARQMEEGSPFYVVEGRDLLGSRPVVGIRELSPYLEAAVIPPTIQDEVLGERESIVAHTLNFVVPDSEDEAYYLAGLFNSWPLRTLSYDLAQPKGGRPVKRFDMYLVSSLPVPEFDPSDPAHRRIADLSRRAHETADSGGDVDGLETNIDRTVSEEVYGLSAAERERLRAHYRRLAYTPD